jgi:hypothetical protein
MSKTIEENFIIIEAYCDVILLSIKLVLIPLWCQMSIDIVASKFMPLEVQLKIFGNLDMSKLTKHGNVVKTLT